MTLSFLVLVLLFLLSSAQEGCDPHQPHAIEMVPGFLWLGTPCAAEDATFLAAVGIVHLFDETAGPGSAEALPRWLEKEVAELALFRALREPSLVYSANKLHAFAVVAGHLVQAEEMTLYEAMRHVKTAWRQLEGNVALFDRPLYRQT